MDRQEHNLDRRSGLMQSAGRIDSIQDRHGDINHNHVGKEAEDRLDIPNVPVNSKPRDVKFES